MSLSYIDYVSTVVDNPRLTLIHSNDFNKGEENGLASYSTCSLKIRCFPLILTLVPYLLVLTPGFFKNVKG
jgi:hypothetical protein